MTQFLNAASGLPLSQAASAALNAGFAHAWADSSRGYGAARRSRDLLDQCRETVAGVLNCPPSGVLFTADPESAMASAVGGFLYGPRSRLALSAMESLPVLRYVDTLAAAGVDVALIEVDQTGRINLGSDALRHPHPKSKNPIVACVQLANLEIGTRQDVAELRRQLPAGSIVVCDATAVLGRDSYPDTWDALWADPRMWGGPPGVGILAVKQPDQLHCPNSFREGKFGLESAPAAVPLIAAAALSLEVAVKELNVAPPTLTLTNRLRQVIAETIPDTQVLGHETERVAHISMFSFLYVAADELVAELDRRGWSVASGASCTADTRRPHHVLVAIGASTHGSLRVSLSPTTSAATLELFAAELTQVVAALRLEAGVTGL